MNKKDKLEYIFNCPCCGDDNLDQMKEFIISNQHHYEKIYYYFSFDEKTMYTLEYKEKDSIYTVWLEFSKFNIKDFHRLTSLCFLKGYETGLCEDDVDYFEIKNVKDLDDFYIILNEAMDDGVFFKYEDVKKYIDL